MVLLLVLASRLGVRSGITEWQPSKDWSSNLWVMCVKISKILSFILMIIASRPTIATLAKILSPNMQITTKVHYQKFPPYDLHFQIKLCLYLGTQQNLKSPPTTRRNHGFGWKNYVPTTQAPKRVHFSPTVSTSGPHLEPHMSPYKSGKSK